MHQDDREQEPAEEAVGGERLLPRNAQDEAERRVARQWEHEETHHRVAELAEAARELLLPVPNARRGTAVEAVPVDELPEEQ